MRNGSLLLPTACEQTMTYRAECPRVKCKSSVSSLESAEALMAAAEQGSMAGDKRLSQKDPGLWLLMLRILDWAWLFSPGG